jgi:surfeit locus 1 family protein
MKCPKHANRTARRSARKPASLAPLWRRLLWPGFFALIAFAILCALGIWQIERLAWKQDLIARVENRSRAEARPLPPEQDWPQVSAARDEYRHVRLEGKFRYDREAFAYALLSDPRGRFSGPGYWVMTPLELDSGALVFVNRGFVPMDRMDLPTRTAGQEGSRVTITGLLRMPEGRNWFTPPDDTGRRIWQERDPAAIARAEGLARVAPFFVDAEESGPGGLPQGGETRVTFSNNHLQYVVTWFGLALALLAVFAAFAHKEWQRGRA